MRTHERLLCSILLVASLGVPAFAGESGNGLDIKDVLIPGYSRIMQGDAEGYWTAPGTAMMLAGQVYVLSQQQGLTLYGSLPYALAVTASEYGAESLIYETNRSMDMKLFPRDETMSFWQSLSMPFAYDFSRPVDLLGIGLVAVASIISVEPFSGELTTFFSSDTVPLWGTEMNPYLAASCFLGYTAVTNAFVASSEETASRSILLDKILIHGLGVSETTAVLGSAAAFGFLHLSNLLSNINDADFRNGVYRQAISATGMGLILGVVYLVDPSENRKAGLGYSTRLHYLWNVLAMNTGYWVDIGKKKRSGASSAISSVSRSSGVSVSPCSITFRFALN